MRAVQHYHTVVVNGVLVSFERAGVTYTVQSDATLGHVRSVTDSNGTVVYTARYDAWGNVLTVTDNVPGGMPYRYVGALGVRWDAGTGLYYMRHRWYDPGLQQFMSVDPLRSNADLYEYANDGPTRFTDPTGYSPPNNHSNNRHWVTVTTYLGCRVRAETNYSLARRLSNSENTSWRAWRWSGAGIENLKRWLGTSNHKFMTDGPMIKLVDPDVGMDPDLVAPADPVFWGPNIAAPVLTKFFTVMCHGEWWGPSIGRRVLSASEMVGLLKHFGYNQGMGIFLASCSLGMDTDFCSKLANGLHVPVVAPTSKIYPNPEGLYYFKASDAVGNMGIQPEWRLYMPGTSLPDTFPGVVM